VKRFDIVMHGEDGTRELAGVLALSDPGVNGRYAAEFRYERRWLESTQGFALDPESLPLSSGIFTGFNLNPPLAVFNDALPDRWGRALLLDGLPLSGRSDMVLVTLRGSNGLGAIEFIDQESKTTVPASVASATSLGELLDAARRFEAGLPVEDLQLRRLLAAGTTAGGARPKATVSDESGEWIVKFPSDVLDGRFDVTGLEKAMMDCAEAAGMEVPKTRLVRIGDRKVLFVKRFDVTARGGRYHMISLSTLCKERTDYRVSSYHDLADAVRKHSAQPIDDLARLFRHALFNGLAGNTDDHLKNLSMRYVDHGYRLSPAYDLIPDIGANREHVLFFRRQRYIDSIDTVMEMAGQWGVADPIGVLRAVSAGLAHFREFALRAGVPETNIAEVEWDLERRARCVDPL
jgi:serine/threonine-protein kinase HipA